MQNANANAKCKCKMKNANANANANAKCIMQNANLKFSPEPKIFTRTQNFCPNLKFSSKLKFPNLKYSPEPKIFAQTQIFCSYLKFSCEPNNAECPNEYIPLLSLCTSPTTTPMLSKFWQEI